MIRSAPTNWNPRCRQSSLAEKQTYKLWVHIKNRCTNPRSNEWKNYGAKGIRLHGNWFSFPSFLADVGTRPSSFHTLRRIDRDGDFAPGNVKWMTEAELSAMRKTCPKQVASLTRAKFMRRGVFDWDAWRAAGEPEIG